MKFDYKLIEKHASLVAEMIIAINKDLNVLENNEKKDELFSLINIIERYNDGLHKCVSVYRKCERNLIR